MRTKVSRDLDSYGGTSFRLVRPLLLVGVVVVAWWLWQSIDTSVTVDRNEDGYVVLANQFQNKQLTVLAPPEYEEVRCRSNNERTELRYECAARPRALEAGEAPFVTEVFVFWHWQTRPYDILDRVTAAAQERFPGADFGEMRSIYTVGREGVEFTFHRPGSEGSFGRIRAIELSRDQGVILMALSSTEAVYRDAEATEFFLSLTFELAGEEDSPQGQ